VSLVSFHTRKKEIKTGIAPFRFTYKAMVTTLPKQIQSRPRTSMIADDNQDQSKLLRGMMMRLRGIDFERQR
jgi:hypothetical protein